MQDSYLRGVSSQENPVLVESDERYGGIYTGDITFVDMNIFKTGEILSPKNLDKTADSLNKN